MPTVRAVAGYFGQWSQGNMPAAGGILDQAATFVQAMRILEVAQSEVIRRREERQQAERDKAARQQMAQRVRAQAKKGGK